MSFDVMLPLRDVLREVGDDNDVRAVVLTGAGKGSAPAPTRAASAAGCPTWPD